MTSVVYDFDAIRRRMPGAAPPGDRRILALFREWQAVWRDPEQARKLLAAIAETPAEGFAGVMVKTYLTFRGLNGDGDTDPDDIDPVDEAMSGSLTKDILRLVAETVPELAPLCAPADW
jgi:hypothetical protein